MIWMDFDRNYLHIAIKSDFGGLTIPSLLPFSLFRDLSEFILRDLIFHRDKLPVFHRVALVIGSPFPLENTKIIIPSDGAMFPHTTNKLIHIL